jgi:hypothetical protein
VSRGPTWNRQQRYHSTAFTLPLSTQTTKLVSRGPTWNRQQRYHSSAYTLPLSTRTTVQYNTSVSKEDLLEIGSNSIIPLLILFLCQLELQNWCQEDLLEIGSNSTGIIPLLILSTRTTKLVSRGPTSNRQQQYHSSAYTLSLSTQVSNYKTSVKRTYFR